MKPGYIYELVLERPEFARALHARPWESQLNKKLRDGYGFYSETDSSKVIDYFITAHEAYFSNIPFDMAILNMIEREDTLL